MSIPKPVYNPPFDVTRASHSVLTVQDLAKSRNFYIDLENEPVRWSVSDAAQRRWQLPARRQWFAEASRFAGVEPRDPDRPGAPRALEDFLAAGMR